ncbi:hypothetical protein QUB57_01495 [Microcoleus sp. F6_C1]
MPHAPCPMPHAPCPMPHAITKDFAKKPGFLGQRVRPHSILHCEEVGAIPRGCPSPLKENI